MTTRFIQITDLHLSDRTDTPTYQALLWAVQETNRLCPDFVVVSGDMTTYGNQASAQNVIKALQEIQSPVFFTPGNAEHRQAEAMPVFSAWRSENRFTHNDIVFHFPDTSRGKISTQNYKHLQEQSASSKKHVIVTHYPIDALDQESKHWMTGFLENNNVELYVAGHKHIHRTRQIGTCKEFITRGLDPDKASGHLPGISLFERDNNGHWQESFIPWDFRVSLMPCEISELPSPVGWSIQGDPIVATQETRATDLNVLEIRPKDLTFSTTALKNEIHGLRNNRPLYLSWHLPNLLWNTTQKKIEGITEITHHLATALEIGVNHLTVHVPHIPAHLMRNVDIWSRFEDLYDEIFRQAVSTGVRLAIENVHNDTGVMPTDPTCKFATDIDTYIQWINAVKQRFSNIPNAKVGSHFDIGHGRNNGEYSNMYPLADWYAQIGKHILGYHIHQIRTTPKTGKLANHKEMFSLFETRISYAGFLHAWSTQLINRAPLFVEIRDADERRRSTQRLHNFFLKASQYQTATDFPIKFQ